MKKLNVYMVGVGGQGILTIADMIMRGAEKLDVPANYFPTKGMAQRGGFVKAQLKLGSETVGPDIRPRGADICIAMELCESLKALRYIKQGGVMVVLGHRWLPTDVMLGKAPYPTVDEVKQAAADAEVRMVYLDPALMPEGCAENIYLLGAALTHTELSNLLDADTLAEAITARWPKGAERNMKSLQAGLAVK